MLLRPLFSIRFDPRRIKKIFFDILPKATISVFFAFAIVVALDFFTVQMVIIEGSNKLSVEVDRFRGKNILFLKKNEIEGDVRQRYITLEDIKVTKSFPNTIKISAKNKIPVAQVKRDNLYFLIDRAGLVFSSSAEKKQAPLLNGFFGDISVGSRFEKNFAEKIFTFLSLLSYGDTIISRVDVLNNQTVRLKEPLGVVISYSTSIDPLTAASSLQMMMRSFRIEGKYPKQIDMLYDKPVVTF